MAGAQCCSNPPNLNPSGGDGHVEQLGGLSTYVTGPSDSKLAVLFASDIFGYEAPNLRKIADKVAAAGYYVVVPDFIHGDPFDFSNTERPLHVWNKSHAPEKGFEEAKSIIADLKAKGVSTVGAVGYCWGAKVVVELAKTALIQASVLIHPYQVTTDDIKDVQVPISILGAETDYVTPQELIKQYEEVLNGKPEVDSFVKIFPEVEHGWTVRYDAANAEAVKKAEEAYEYMYEWLSKYVK